MAAHSEQSGSVWEGKVGHTSSPSESVVSWHTVTHDVLLWGVKGSEFVYGSGFRVCRVPG